jgi:hypothetical protein
MTDRPLVDDIGLDDLDAVLRAEAPAGVTTATTTRRSRVLPGPELYHPGEREAWAEWLKRYGAEPGEVVIPGMIVADDTARTIGWLTLDRTPDGRLVPNPDVPGQPRYLLRTVQLEAPALPFPDDAPDWPWP